MKYMLPEYDEYKTIVDKMSVEELLRTVICPNIGNDKTVLHNNTGSVFFHGEKSDVLKKRIEYVNKNRELPAIIATDVEGGAAGIIQDATHFPSMMACAKAGSEELAYEMGKISAIESRRVGFEWAFGPDIDILGNYESPVTSNRCCGPDYKQDIKIAGAVMRGMQDYGLAAAVKHFPGDGYCRYDQHLTVAENPLPFDEWMNTYGEVYRYMIDNGVKSIMPGHISLPSYDDIDEETGLFPPGTMSKKLLTELLKNTLGFGGIIVSDGTTMGGFCGYLNYYKACARFLEAGGDCLIFVQPDDMFYSEMKKLLDNGYLKIETLKNRAYRMLCFAKDLKSFKDESEVTSEYAKKISDEIVKRSIDVVRDRKNIIPFNIKKNSRILHLIIGNYSSVYDDKMTDEIKKYSNYVDVLSDPGPDGALAAVKNGKYDLVICTINAGAAYGTNVVRLHGPVARNMMSGWMRYDTPVIFVVKGHGYFHKEYYAIADTVINTYGTTDATVGYLMKKITGNFDR